MTSLVQNLKWQDAYIPVAHRICTFEYILEYSTRVCTYSRYALGTLVPIV